MTKERLKQLEANNTFGQESLGKNAYEELAEGLLILNKYPGRKHIGAEHDVLYVGDSEVLEQMSEQDCRTMLLLGWHWSKNVDCWATFI